MSVNTTFKAVSYLPFMDPSVSSFITSNAGRKTERKIGDRYRKCSRHTHHVVPIVQHVVTLQKASLVHRRWESSLFYRPTQSSLIIAANSLFFLSCGRFYFFKVGRLPRLARCFVSAHARGYDTSRDHNQTTNQPAASAWRSSSQSFSHVFSISDERRQGRRLWLGSTWL